MINAENQSVSSEMCVCVAAKEGKVNVGSAESRKIPKRHRYSTCLRSLFFKKNLFDSGKKKVFQPYTGGV